MQERLWTFSLPSLMRHQLFDRKVSMNILIIFQTDFTYHFFTQMQIESHLIDRRTTTGYEVHFTLKCQFFQKPRSTFLSALKKRCTSFSGLAENQKLHFLLTNENQQICNIFSRYLYELADMHEKSLSQKSQ